MCKPRRFSDTEHDLAPFLIFSVMRLSQMPEPQNKTLNAIGPSPPPSPKERKPREYLGHETTEQPPMEIAKLALTLATAIMFETGARDQRARPCTYATTCFAKLRSEQINVCFLYSEADLNCYSQEDHRKHMPAEHMRLLYPPKQQTKIQSVCMNICCWPPSAPACSRFGSERRHAGSQ